MSSRVRRLAIVVAPVATYTLIALAPAADAATVTSMKPSFGPVGRTVDIYGSGLTGAKDVTFHGVHAGAPTVVDDGHIRTTVPSGATSGPVRVRAIDNTTTSAGTFSVQLPTRATIARSVGTTVFPGTVRIRSVLRSGGAAVAGQPAELQHARIGTGKWYSMSTVRSTSSTGVVAWRFAPRSTSAYRVVFRATHTHLGTASPHTRVYVRPRVAVRVPGVAPLDTQFRITGRVRPALSGPVYLQTLRNGSWHSVERATASRRAGRYSAPVTLTDTAIHAYRFRRPADATHLAANSHQASVVGISRTLSSGTSGSDVAALQAYLYRLHYDVGRTNGSYGSDTSHAVVAFEKVQGMSRDGVAGPAVLKRLTAPRQPHLLHPFAKAAGVEVDLTHEVLLYGVNGRVRRIFDTSTGGGYTYTGSDGQPQKAITPTGHFHIVYKRDGWVTSDLGQLYRPAYFNYSGYAIHGETEVPPYPASHGCVRITVPAMDRFNAKLPVGLSVWIYHT